MPRTMMFTNKKLAAVACVTGFVKPRFSLTPSILSSSTACARRSDLTRLMAISFSSSDIQRAVSGLSVMVKYARRASIIVMIPSMANIICHPCNEPNDLSFRMPEATRHPNAQDNGAIVIHKPRRKVNSERLYHRER